MKTFQTIERLKPWQSCNVLFDIDGRLWTWSPNSPNMHKGQGENFLIFQKTELGKNFEVLSCFKNHVEIYKNSQLYNLYKYITYPRKPDVDKRYDLL